MPRVHGWRTSNVTSPPRSGGPPRGGRPHRGGSPRGPIRRITFPCYDIDARTLNRKRVRTISGVDLRRVDANDEDLEAAWEAVEKDELIAVGFKRRIRDEGPAGAGIRFVASQFFLRIGPEVDPALFCTDDGDCTATVFHSFVGDPDACYCPLCPATALNLEAERRNRESWQRTCEPLQYGPLGSPTALVPIHARPICPLALCVAPPPVACVTNRCTFLVEAPFGR